MAENKPLKLSLVLPMYGVERWIAACLNSIYSQPDAEQVEVILVDDGSPDKSHDIARHWLENQPINNWRIIRQPNLGLSAARNTGLDAARGEFVWFIDTDDLIAPDAIAKLLSHISPAIDVIAMTYYNIDENGNPLPHHFKNYAELEVSGKDMLLTHELSVCVQFYCMRREFMRAKRLRMTEGLLHEDSEFTPRMMYFADRVQLINGPMYLLRQTPGSITHTVNPKRSFDLLRVANSLETFKRNVNEKNIICEFNRQISTSFNTGLSLIARCDKAERKRFISEATKLSFLPKVLRNSIRFKHNIQGWLMTISTRLTLSLHMTVIQALRKQ